MASLPGTPMTEKIEVHHIRRLSTRTVAIAALVLFIFALGVQPCPAQKKKVRQAEQKIKSSKSELETITEQIEAGASRARGLKKKERSLLRQIHGFELQIDQSKKKLTALNIEINELNDEISYINRQLQSCHRQLEEKKGILHRRLREIYKRGRLHQVSVILGSHSFTDFVKRLKYLTLIAAQDKRLVAEVSQLRHSYFQYKSASERKLALKVDRKTALEQEQRSIKQAETERQRLLGSVKAQRAEVLKVIQQRKAEAESMRKLIAEWERRRKEAIDRARQEGRLVPPEQAHLKGRRGKLGWPVDRGTLIRGFGPYTDKATRTKVINNGIDIKVPAGEDVTSVGNGMVMYVEWFRTYGKTVMVDHGASMMSLYTHLGQIFVEVGQRVYSDQVIARVGSTGSLEGPKLHFEIRRNSKAINPIPWLKKRR
ncbi:MAG: peptidoglycan DD-metalloendopeptidase family protein [Gemmatimonadota bacterium]|nr:peptidoglycan DD-metalloendopeptidase family protein [Gemmatimonadota bacterium]